jgi:hypothetical protein
MVVVKGVAWMLRARIPDTDSDIDNRSNEAASEDRVATDRGAPDTRSTRATKMPGLDPSEEADTGARAGVWFGRTTWTPEGEVKVPATTTVLASLEIEHAVTLANAGANEVGTGKMAACQRSDP